MYDCIEQVGIGYFMCTFFIFLKGYECTTLFLTPDTLSRNCVKSLIKRSYTSIWLILVSKESLVLHWRSRLIHQRSETRLGITWELGLIRINTYNSRHTNRNNRDNTINLIHLFRDYLHYHIKCSKVSYTHKMYLSVCWRKTTCLKGKDYLWF